MSSSSGGQKYKNQGFGRAGFLRGRICSLFFSDCRGHLGHLHFLVYGPFFYHQRRQWHPTPVLLPGKSHGWRSLVGCSPWGREESDTTEQLHFHFSLSSLEKEMATHSSVLAWRIPGTGEPGGLPSMGSHRVGHNWSDLAANKEKGMIWAGLKGKEWEISKERYFPE